jgi:hypothetical protein
VCSTLLSAVGSQKARQLEEYNAAMSQERANHSAAVQVTWHRALAPWLTQRACNSVRTGNSCHCACTMLLGRNFLSQMLKSPLAG